VHLVGFIIRIYHDSRSSERQNWSLRSPALRRSTLCIWDDSI